MIIKASLFLIASILLCGCASKNQSAEANANQSNTVNPNVNQSNTGTGTPQQKAELKVSSTAFQEGGLIPKGYTCDGANISPPIMWEGVPEKAKTLALIADDPDAPAKTWVHWVVFNLPAGVRELRENVAPQKSIMGGGVQGTNDFPKVGYGGPCPPNGTHRYFFKLYALDTELSLEAATTKEQLLKAMEGHIIAEGQLMGKYSR
ncbi:MAG TPA: YbhB/YbcL family Raf kinase inhibitor-like protein [Pyrinomonadaceae bacterium]